MSDHGLPTPHQHNEKAFYSCNRELFGDTTPLITDFHDRILDIVGEDEVGKEQAEDEESELSKEEEEQVKKNLEDMGYI